MSTDGVPLQPGRPTPPPPRVAVRLRSGPVELAAWHYPGTTGACVVMAGGFAVTKEPATDRFAARFHAAGLSVLAFDYRRLGGSGGSPRQVVHVREALDDWSAAVEHARTLPGVDGDRIAAWGFSASAGHIFALAARDRRLAAAVAQSANAGGPAATSHAMAFQHKGTALRVLGLGLLDAAGGLVGREPLLIPLGGRPGEVAALTTPDVPDGVRALGAEAGYPDWPQVVAARSVLTLGTYRPGRHAPRIACPLLVVVCEDDHSALPAAAERVARRAPRGELVRLPGGHYAPFLAAHEQAVAAHLDFLRRHLNLADPEEPRRTRPGTDKTVPARPGT
ncbi:alpha/beta hydrolase [Kitasatospora sp. NPDC056181]|uniref:alpha/beta hydrolase n=1 Tax=Kitasatospora sp. NPDC056181 TaxID=3345737 RepID=UPI0035E19422